MAIVICLTFVAAILNISISPRVPEWHKPDSEYIGYVVLKTVITNWGWTPIQDQHPNYCLAAGLNSHKLVVMSVVINDSKCQLSRNNPAKLT